MEDKIASDSRAVQLAEVAVARRKELHLTQDILADLAGCSPRFIRAFEQGKATARLDKVIDVLDALGLQLTATRRLS